MSAKKIVKIEKDIEIPLIKREGKGSIWPFDSMNPMESFFAQEKMSVMNAAISRYIKTDKGKSKVFTVRSTIEKVEGVDQKGVRVWRTE